MNRIIIIDGNSLLFRAYYATAFPGAEIMHSDDGTPTNAIFAFSNMMNKILSNVKKGEGVFVAFDAGKHNFRHDELESYKANRKPAPEDLVKQFPIAREFLKALNVYQFEQVGFEGDDIAGTIAKKAKEAGYEVEIYTSDRDFLQLIEDHIQINIIKKGLSDVHQMNEEKVKEEYGILPSQIIDYKGLRGDASDNLPGIPGIGDKTAVKLINEYGSFENIMAHKEKIKGKVSQMLIENESLGRTSYQLAIIKTDIDLPFAIEDVIYQGYDFQTLANFCQKYGFKQFINKVQPKWRKKDISDIKISPKESMALSSFLKEKDIPYENIKSVGIALDLENDDYSTAKIIGLSLAIEEDTIYFDYDEIKKDQLLLALLKDKNILKSAYDYKAIKVALKNHNIDIDGLGFDILIASYLLDSSLKNNEETVFSLHGINIANTEEEISLFSSKQVEKTAKVALYSLVLENKIKKELEKINSVQLFYELELPLVDALADMEIEGIPLDQKYISELGKIYQEQIDNLTKEIYSLAGQEFNISSPKQLAEILYDKLGLPNLGKGSTSIEYLSKIIKTHPIIQAILDYRKYFKLVSTYIEPLLAHQHSDGKIHAKFNQALTTTGRLSSSDPNLQNISMKDIEGKQIRKAFHYDNDEYSILSLDYSQIELRVLASLSSCEGLIKIFLNNEDIHAETAKKIFNLQEPPTELERRKAKTVNFGVVYGISDWGLAEQLDISPKEAKAFITNFYQTYPEVNNFFQNVISQATKDGYVSTLLGRRRYLRELHDSSYQVREFAKRAAMNAPIQGSAADLIKIAMVKVHEKLLKGQYKSKIILQIHDELVLKVHKDEKDAVYALAKNEMENAMRLKVPLVVGGGFGASWYDAK